MRTKEIGLLITSALVAMFFGVIVGSIGIVLWRIRK